DLLISIFLLPTLYVGWARPTDRLPARDDAKSVFEEEARLRAAHLGSGPQEGEATNRGVRCWLRSCRSAHYRDARFRAAGWPSVPSWPRGADRLSACRARRR